MQGPIGPCIARLSYYDSDSHPLSAFSGSTREFPRISQRFSAKAGISALSPAHPDVRLASRQISKRDLIWAGPIKLRGWIMKTWAAVIVILIVLFCISYGVRHPHQINQTWSELFPHNGQ